MGRITFQPISISLTTNGSGDANLSVRVPGTFTGPSDDKSGRFLKFIDVWSDSGTDGDRICDLRIEDSDAILAGIGLSGNFADYPVLYYFEDREVEESASVKRGLYLINGLTRLEKIDQRDPHNFIPSGMYLKGTFKTANVVALGQKVRINLGWGKNI